MTSVNICRNADESVMYKPGQIIFEEGQPGDVMYAVVEGAVEITVAEERRPIFPFFTQRLHWPFEDPATFSGTDAEKAAKFRAVRDLIDQRLRTWLQERQVLLAAQSIQAAAQ